MEPIEKELLKATGEEPQQSKGKKKESRQDYLHRLTKAANDLEQKDWKKLSADTQKWVNKAVDDFSDDISDFDAEDAADEEEEEDEDEKPKSKSSKSKKDDDDDEEEEDAAEDDEDEDAADEDEDEKPKSKSSKSKKDDDDEEEDEKPKGKGKSKKDDDDEEDTDEDAADDDDTEDEDEDEEDEKPKKSKSKDGDEDPEDKEAATAFLRRLIVKNPDLDRQQCRERLEKKGYKISAGTASVTYYETKKTLDLLRKLGKLAEEEDDE